MCWSEGVKELVSDGATYRAVPLFSEGQLKIYHIMHFVGSGLKYFSPVGAIGEKKLVLSSVEAEQQVAANWEKKKCAL